MRRGKKAKATVVEKVNEDLTEVIKENRNIIHEVFVGYEENCRNGNVDKANNYHKYLKHHCTVQRILEAGAPSDLDTVASKEPRIIFSARLAKQTQRKLTDGTGKEKFVYITGVIDRSSNTYVPTEILEPRMAERSSVHAKGDQRSVNDVLCSLDEENHTILLKAHKHPGKGPSSVNPSGTDLKTHKDLEVCYPVVGVIYSIDGYFRFFSSGRKFRVEIYGTGVKKIDNRTFCIKS